MVHQARSIIRKRRRVSIPEETQTEIPISNSSGRQTFSDGSDFEGNRRPKRARKPKRSRNLENDPKTKLLAQDSKSPTKSTKRSVPSPSGKSPKMAKHDYSANAVSPFPNWKAPSQKAVETVFQLLEDKHCKIGISQSKPSLGLRIEGCNEEEPALIDAIIRACLSAGTNDMNASRAFMGILKRFGRRKPGSGIGIVDWEAVRLAPLEDLYEAIKTGVMGNVKSLSLKLYSIWCTRRTSFGKRRARFQAMQKG